MILIEAQSIWTMNILVRVLLYLAQSYHEYFRRFFCIQKEKYEQQYSCGARLAPFDIKELRDLMEYDDLELDNLGGRKTALFLIMSDTDTTLSEIRKGYAILIREELAAQNKNRQNRDTISRQFS